ncbi:MAG: hypothetical protein GX021_02965 [Tissierellia bacterium]|nr:hypothetical protein [Tissierellia bacterium]
MKERLKTLLLISLVSISLILTKRLWIELPNEMFNLFNNKDKAYSASYLLSDMIIPNKYLLNFNEKYHTIFYDDSKHGLWTNTQKILATTLGSEDIKITDISSEEFSTYNWKPSIVFYFPEKINTYILAKALDVKDPNYIVDAISSVKSIYIYLGTGDPFFVLSNDENHKIIYDNSIDNEQLKEQFLAIEEDAKVQGKGYNFYYSLKDIYGADKDIYVPYEMNGTVPTVYVENQIRNLDIKGRREIAEKFFEKSIDYIREIVEGNESTIYEYNNKVLKLNVNGTVEYYHPLEETVKKRNLYESLSTAAEFISRNAGITKGMYLDKFEEIEVDNSVGYNLKFKYRLRGLPVILGNEEVVDFIEIEVFNNHVRSYKHFIRKDMNKIINNIQEGKKMLHSFQIIDMNYDFLVEEYLKVNNSMNGAEVALNEVLSFIEDINLSYFDPCLKDIEDEVVPVWVIKTVNGLYAFNVYSGSLIYEKTGK